MKFLESRGFPGIVMTGNTHPDSRNDGSARKIAFAPSLKGTWRVRPPFESGIVRIPFFHINLIPLKIEWLFPSKPGLNQKYHKPPVFRYHDTAKAL